MKVFWASIAEQDRTDVQGEVVWILALVHTARRWPGLLG